MCPHISQWVVRLLDVAHCRWRIACIQAALMSPGKSPQGVCKLMGEGSAGLGNKPLCVTSNVQGCKGLGGQMLYDELTSAGEQRHPVFMQGRVESK